MKPFFIISYSYHYLSPFFSPICFKKQRHFQFLVDYQPMLDPPALLTGQTWNCLWPRVQATTTQWRPRCSSGLPAVPSKDESWKNTVAQEGFKHWLSHSMPGMRKRNSPCWRTHPRHQCLQCVDAKICGPPKIHHVPTSDKFVTYRVRSSLGPLFVSCINQHATGNFGVDFETSPFGMWWVWIWNVILQMRGTQDLSKLRDRKVWVKSLWWISSMWPFVDIASFVFTSSERSFCMKSRSAANSQHTRREEQLGASASSN